jgi:hypothetical protein
MCGVRAKEKGTGTFSIEVFSTRLHNVIYAVNMRGLQLYLILFFPLIAVAEMPPQDPKKADIIVVGQVEGINKTLDFETDHFTISVRIEVVERGTGVAVGDAISVNTFKWARPGPGKVGASGHRGMPSDGDQIRLYAYQREGGYSGAYPVWFDLLKKSEEPDAGPVVVKKTVDQPRWVTQFSIIGVSALLGLIYGIWQWWKQKRKPPTPPAPAVEA